MHVIDTYVGQRDDAPVAARLERDGFETVAVGDDERRRSRFRTETDAGTEVGVVVGHDIRTGDVLAGDGLLVVVELDAVEALVVGFADVDVDADASAFLAAVELGHAVGNRHWDLAVRDGEVLLPLVESRARMEATVDPHLPDGATVSVESVPPTTFDGRERGHTQDGTGHTHGDDHAHGAGHEHTHSHEHEHGHGYGHADGTGSADTTDGADDHAGGGDA